jgi:starch-binding outer membrane protein, SusD/RagB family
MKNIKFLTIAALALLVISCNEDFLDTKNLTEKLDVDYYKTPTEISDALTAVYSLLQPDAGNNNPILVSEIMSDDRFSGGGTNDVGFFNTDQFLNTGDEKYYEPLWKDSYWAIFRANMILKRIDDQAKYPNEADKKQAKGEALFLRAYFYFRIGQFFGPGPLILDPAPVNLPKAEPDKFYAQIATDLKNAIDLMPATPYSAIPVTRLGHATKWAAEGLMARVFLFYTGYYNKGDLPLVDGSSVTKADAIGWVDECVASSGHNLIPDFRNLWPYTFSPTCPYILNNNLKWIGEDGANVETVFAIKFSPYGGWGAEPLKQKLSYSNQLTLYMGLRGSNNSLIPWGQGWGGGPVNPQLWDTWDDNDVRKIGTILDVTNPDEGMIATKYQWNGDNSQHETGLYNKKYIPIQVNVGTQRKGMYFSIYGAPDNMQLWNMQDIVLIRFADILLMGAELGSAKAQQYMDKVRSRAGLASVPVNLANIKVERRHELAGEGLRYFDLLRWHDAEAAFAVANNISVVGKFSVKTLNTPITYTVTYRPETGGFLPIPLNQVRLSNGVLKQNAGW